MGENGCKACCYYNTSICINYLDVFEEETGSDGYYVHYLFFYHLPTYLFNPPYLLTYRSTYLSIYHSYPSIYLSISTYLPSYVSIINLSVSLHGYICMPIHILHIYGIYTGVSVCIMEITKFKVRIAFSSTFLPGEKSFVSV